MILTFCYNEIITRQENVIEINLCQDDSHDGEYYYQIWIQNPGEQMYSEDHHPQYITCIEENTNKVLAAFQTWRNGSKIQVSAFYEGDEVSDFIEKHRNSGTFATLHTFTNMAQADAMYEGFLEDATEY